MWIEANHQYPNGMYSVLSNENFAANRGELWAAIRKDMLTNGSHPSYADLFNGRDMMGKSIRIRLTNSEDSDDVVLSMVKVKSIPTR